MNIAIAGYGIEGAANYRYWASDPENTMTILDERERALDGVKFSQPVASRLGADAFNNLEEFDLVVRTAGLSPDKLKSAKKVWSGTNEFFSKCPAPIIGVTGTKGKGTTASLIASILEAAGKKVWLVGNIGEPSLDILHKVASTDVVVYELSSFQLWDIEYSPHIAVVLGIEPEHLDVHSDFSDYIGAKTNIRRHQKAGDICIYKEENEHARSIAYVIEAPKKEYGIHREDGAYVKNDYFYVDDRKVCPTRKLRLRGAHNVENACAAVAVAVHMDISNGVIASGIRAFVGLEHRIEYVTKIKGVSYYNDSFSSAVSSTIAAIDSFHEPEIVIIGGIDRGADFSKLVKKIANTDNVKEVILIGAIRHKLHDLFLQDGKDVRVMVSDETQIDPIVRYAASVAEPGDVVLLSPSCASFDMFKNFYDRGEKFKRAVANLQEESVA